MAIGIIYEVSLSPKARMHAKAIRKYYREINTELSDSFTKNLAERLLSLTIFHSYEIKFANVRAVSVYRFPYLIYFTVDEVEKTVHVIAVLHDKQERPRME